jgi:hypothetical protein
VCNKPPLIIPSPAGVATNFRETLRSGPLWQASGLPAALAVIVDASA